MTGRGLAAAGRGARGWLSQLTVPQTLSMAEKRNISVSLSPTFAVTVRRVSASANVTLNLAGEAAKKLESDMLAAAGARAPSPPKRSLRREQRWCESAAGDSQDSQV